MRFLATWAIAIALQIVATVLMVSIGYERVVEKLYSPAMHFLSMFGLTTDFGNVPLNLSLHFLATIGYGLLMAVIIFEARRLVGRIKEALRRRSDLR